MFRNTLLLIFSASFLLVAGCGHQGPVSSPSDENGLAAKLTVSSQRAGGSRIVVMSRNVYLGADIDPIVQESDPNMVPLRVAEAWLSVQANNYPERAQTLAEEITQVQPHLIGLQEVALYRIQAPGDFLQGNPLMAEAVALDYLEILLEALRAKGMHYRPVAISTNADIELPLPLSSTEFNDLRLSDRDVILARSDVRIVNSQNGSYAVNLEVEVGGVPVVFKRGWTSVDTRIAGQAFRFVNTHLEGRGGGLTEPIQIAQAAELEQLTRDLELPVVLAGDFNSSASGNNAPGTSYSNLLATGFVDVWTRANGDEEGFTADHPKDLRSEVVELNRRIDLVLVRPAYGRNPFRGQPSAGRVGAALEERTPSGLWPSDHAGVWARFRLKGSRLVSR